MALPVRRSDDELARWDPLTELERINRTLSGYLDSWRQLPEVLGAAFTPLADVEETDDAFVVEIELPGVKGDDVEVLLAGRHLTVSGERKERERVGILRRRTRVVGRFRYEVTLPGDVVDDGVEAHFDDGVLTVRVPKAASERPRRIKVS